MIIQKRSEMKNLNKARTKWQKETTHTQYTKAKQMSRDVTSFKYLGRVITITRGTGQDVLARIRKVRRAFNIFGGNWRSGQITTASKVRPFDSNAKTILLYRSETWRMTVKIVLKLQTFINRCPHRFVRVFCPSAISNFNPWEITGQAAVKQQIIKRKWSCIGKTVSGPSSS